MNLNQRNLVLLAVAAGLCVPTWLQLRRDAETFVDFGGIPLLFDGFTADNVGSLLLAKPKDEQPAPNPNQTGPKPIAYDQLAIQRTDKGWQVGGVPGQAPGDLVGAPVSKDRVEQMVFEHLRSIRNDRDALVQPDATPEQLKEFGLDEEHAFLVRAVDKTGARVVAELLVGRDAGAGKGGTDTVRGQFVRKRDSNDVVLYETTKPWLRSIETDVWLERMLLRADPDKVRRLSIRNAATGAKPFVFAREPGKAMWQAVDPPDGLGALRQAQVEGLSNRFRYFAAQGYLRPLTRAGNMQALGLFPPQIELSVTVEEDGQQRVVDFAIGNKLDDKNEYYLTSNESQFLMTVPAGNVVPFELDVKEQMFDPAPGGGEKPGDDKGGEPKPGEKPKDDRGGK